MDILYNVDERYLQAVEELMYGDLPKALHYFSAIIDTDPDHARAHYHVGCCYYYHFKDYQTAGYYFKKCIELEPGFPDVYSVYLKLLITLKIHKAIYPTADKALLIPGVNEAEIFETLGNYAEKNQDLVKAKEHYQKAAAATTDQNHHRGIKDHIIRVADKQNAKRKVVYAYQD
jgi:tetratricopeptide (TPR) repeat protein